jgi:pilus assembly protein CpaB
VNRRVIGAIAAVLLAVIGTVLLVSYVNGAADRAASGEKEVNVLVVTGSVPAGTKSADLKGDVALKQVPEKVRADGAITSLSQVEGLVTNSSMVSGEQLVKSRFGTVGAAGVRRMAAPSGLLEVTVSLDPERALGGTIGAGDYVGVFASFDQKSIIPGPTTGAQTGVTPIEGAFAPNTGGSPESTHLILHKILVTNVQVNQADESTTNTTVPSDSTKAATAPQHTLLVTLAVSAGQAEKVVFAAEHGRLWLASEPKDANEGGTQVQTRASIDQ